MVTEEEHIILGAKVDVAPAGNLGGKLLLPSGRLQVDGCLGWAPYNCLSFRPPASGGRNSGAPSSESLRHSELDSSDRTTDVNY